MGDPDMFVIPLECRGLGSLLQFVMLFIVVQYGLSVFQVSFRFPGVFIATVTLPFDQILPAVSHSFV